MSDLVITWNIANLERETADGFVFTAHYTIEATDGIYRSSAYGSINFERPNNLIPYADLTKEQVLQWVKEELGSDKVAGVEEALAERISEQRKPTKQAGVPWDN